MSVGGAVAGGARLAVASEFEPATFWDEVRRYGATVVSYTWAMLDEIAEAPPNPGEQHHPVRLFMGSGMPRGLWRRVSERFAPAPGARVLRLDRGRRGARQPDRAKGRVQGPAAAGQRRGHDRRLRPARPAPDPRRRRLRDLAAPARAGMLLARVRADSIGTGDGVLRGVFEPGDAWLETGDLFRRDADGDYWLVDHVPALIRTATGVVSRGRSRTRSATSTRSRSRSPTGCRPSAAGPRSRARPSPLRRARSSRSATVERALADLGDGGIPWVIRVVDEIPLTTWYRPDDAARSRPRGCPRRPKPATSWYWDPRKGGYRPMSKAAMTPAGWQGLRVRILFVCLGNICRSPTAEGVMRHKLRAAGLAEDVDVESAGTGGWHVGHPPDERASAAAAAARDRAREPGAEVPAGPLRRLRPDRRDGPPEPRGHARARSARRGRGQARICCASSTRSRSRPGRSRSPIPTTGARGLRGRPRHGRARLRRAARGDPRELAPAMSRARPARRGRPGARRTGSSGRGGSAAATSTTPGCSSWRTEPARS